jgi:hypothetical protein
MALLLLRRLLLLRQLTKVAIQVSKLTRVLLLLLLLLLLLFSYPQVSGMLRMTPMGLLLLRRLLLLRQLTKVAIQVSKLTRVLLLLLLLFSFISTGLWHAAHDPDGPAAAAPSAPAEHLGCHKSITSVKSYQSPAAAAAVSAGVWRAVHYPYGPAAAAPSGSVPGCHN